MGPPLSQTAKNSRSFLFRDVTIRLASSRLDRKRRERYEAPTSLIISRPRHPFYKKTDKASILMERLEMFRIIKRMIFRGGELMVDDIHNCSITVTSLSQYRGAWNF